MTYSSQLLPRLFGVGVFLTLLIWNTAFAQCTGISINTDKKYNCGPGLFRMQLLGTQDAKQITWNFGDGEKIAPDSIYQYLSKTGFIDVKVKVLWKDNSVCDTVFTRLIEIKPMPRPNFSFSRSILCYGPDTVSLFCNTPGATSISWIVDGTNYFNAGYKLTHKFASPGKKGFQVIFTDSFGCRGIVELKDTIEVLEKAQINFSASDSGGCAPVIINLSANFNLYGQKAKNVYWKFESKADSIPGLSVNNIEFRNSGEFSAAFYVLTEKNCLYKYEKPDYIKVGDSLPIVLNKPKSFYCFNEPIVLADLNPKSGGKYSWKLPSNVKWQGDSTGSGVVVKIKDNGVYRFSVSFEKNGCVTKAEYTDSFIVKTVKAEFSSANNFHCEPPLEVNFKSNSYASDTGEIMHYWLFYPQGNPNNPLQFSSLKDPSAIFPDMGNYDVRLVTIHKISGCRDTSIRTSFVRIDTIRPVIMVQPEIACVNQEVFLFNGTQPSTYAGPDSFHWTIYDTDRTTILKESDSMHLTFSSNKAGVYPVKLYGGNPAVCNIHATVFDSIEIVVPKLQFLNFPENACSGTPMRFYGASTPERAKFTHFWEITGMDSSFSFVTKDSMISFKAEGDYDIKYAIQIDKGCRDSIVKKNAIGVNGIYANLILDTLTGCLPFTVKPVLENVRNFHKGHQSDDYTVLWSCMPSMGVTIRDSNTLTPEFVFTEVGAYRILARLQNATGCDTIMYSDTVFAGVDASFDLSDDKVCIGATVTAKATSRLKPSSYKWVTDNQQLEIINQSPSVIQLKSDVEGIFQISLIAEKNQICFDTFSRLLNVIEVKADFRSLDTLLTCAPVYAQFMSVSKNANELIWNYGDGKPFVTKLPSSGHIYTRNSGWSDGFDVSLIAVNYEGCADTMLKEDFVWVLGPVPKVKLYDYSGCTPVHMKIEDLSTDAVRYIVDYGDNKAWDSTKAPNEYSYQFTQVFGDTQRYELRVFAYDSMGCIAKFEPEEKIEVYRSPIAVSNIISTNTCNYSDVVFQDLSKKTSNRLWRIFDKGDTIFNTNSQWKHAFTEIGQYPVDLTVYNYMHCSSVKRDTIHVYPDVQVNITRTDTVCLNKPVSFSAEGKSLGIITESEWEITQNGTLIGADKGFSGTYTLNVAGNYNLNFIIKNEFGCIDTATNIIFVQNPEDAPDPQIRYVSIRDNKTELFSEPSTNPRYFQSTVYYNGSTAITSIDRNKDYWSPLDLLYNSGQQCYQMDEVDLCGNIKKSEIHCPVILNAQSNDYFKIDLTWSGYTGWNDLLSYRLLRSENGTSFIQLAELSPVTLRYTDSPLCPGTYYYMIQAINQRGDTSQSNMVIQVPMYRSLGNSPDIRDIRVIENNQIAVKWDKSQSIRHEFYELHKSNGLAKPQVILVKDTFYTDFDVLPEEETYKYEIRDRDVCGISNTAGRFGISILLKGEYREDQSELNWNDYENWEEGVLKYQVLIEKPQGYVPVSDVVLQSLYSDPVIYPEIKADYCYKIHAVSAPAGRDTSISNYTCLIGPSRIYIPNAFTPNSDGKNDDFKPVMFFIRDEPLNRYQEYDFMVFNRWGEILFRTDDLSKGWDGKAGGADAQPGVYGYSVQVYGLDGKTYFKSGQVHLIR